MTTPETPFDPARIEITTTETEPNDWRIEFTVPTEQVQRFIRQLKEVKKDIHPQELSSLLITVAIDEAMHRLDRDRLWPFEMSGDKPPVLHPEKPFSGTFQTDAFSMPEWPDFSLLALNLPPADVEDDLVERELIDQRLDIGSRSPLTESLAENDECELSAEIFLPEVETAVIKVPRRAVRVPPAGFPLNLGGLVLPGGDAITGHAAGDAVTFETELPTELPSAELSGRKAQVRAVIHETRRITPADEAEVVARYGSPNAANLRMQIRFALEQRRTEERRRLAGEQILEQLRTFVPTEVPARVARNMVGRRRKELAETYKKEGMTGEALENRLAEIQSTLEQSAQHLASRQAIIALLRMHLGVKHSEDDVLAEINRMAALSGRRPEDLRNEIAAQGKHKTLEQTVILGKLAEAIMLKTNIA